MLFKIGKTWRFLSILLLITSFLSLGSFISKSAIAVVTQVEETSGEVLYRSQV
jgi:hypothetical protein